jgi:hypothetical protein
MNTQTNKELFRPSSLPKLRQCLHYEPGAAGDAAARGTRIDSFFRAILADEKIEAETDQAKAELALARKGVEMLRAKVGDHPILSREQDCKIVVQDSAFEEVCQGTCDAIVPALRLSADLKTGSIRDYTDQMAAYALGCMDRFGVDEWTTLLLYVDQGETVEAHWDYEKTASRFLTLLDAWVLRNNAEPTICEYCHWCRKGPAGDASCSAIAKQLSQLAPIVPLPVDLEQAKASLLADPARAGAFKKAMKIASQIEEAIDAKAKEGGDWCPDGFRVQHRKGRPQVAQDDLVTIARLIGVEKVLSCCSVNASKLREAIEASDDESARTLLDAFVDGPSYRALVETRK